MVDISREQARHEQLVDQINQHRAAYYQGNTSLVSDAEYDAMMHELELLEAEHPEPGVGQVEPDRAVVGAGRADEADVDALGDGLRLDQLAAGVKVPVQ